MPSSGSSADKMVFAHFMIGIVSTYTQQDHENDQSLAKSKGIDGFALNIGVDPYTQQQLTLAYAAAEAVGFYCFISFDFNWWSTGDTAGVANMLKQFISSPAAYKVDGKPFVSSFIGDGFNWGACAAAVGEPLYAVPFFQPTPSLATDDGLAGSFSWAAWPGQLDNVPVDQNMTISRDEDYMDILTPAGKTYMAPVSPWFFTHYGKEVSYSKNWLFYSEELWKYRWDQILQLGQKGVNLVEIVTWNDYGESHNVGPFNTPHTNDGAALWASGLSHTSMLDLSVPYIEAFKAGLPVPVVTQEFMVYWHRPTLKDVECDSTDNCGSKPTGWEYVADSVFVATVTKNGAMVTVTSGDNAPVTQKVSGGIQIFQVPMSAGDQQFSMKTSWGMSTSGSSNVTVLDTCWNGIYNFDFHSGTLS
ncbi:glycoside hydrolase [Kockovaella imperatae]|uniref:Glycoside hydrolase n=1 Tax=Kockovaella imperatae TaxID=4999 RepID=A0A1Y1UGU0_9TREE|nr:glycoside hydrolase [Kockovaella imperatae]ORX37242.1 glycoside hydrolase [Kockovaella imperatae]